MILELLILVIIVLITYHLVLYIKLHHHFDRCGIKYKRGLPVFGNTFNSTFSLKHFIEDVDEVYTAFPDEKYVGYIEGTKKVIVVRDPELMKMITIKDFDHFVNRKDFFPKEVDPLLGSSLVGMKGEEWRTMRYRLTPAFVVSKMKHMVPSMKEVSNNVMEYLNDHQGEDIDVSDLMRRYNTDVIATTLLGNRVNSVKDRNNEFFMIGDSVVNFTIWRKIIFYLALQFPLFAKTMEFLGITLFPRTATAFFRKVVAHTIEYRKTHNIDRPDFVQLLTEALKGNLRSEGEMSQKEYFSGVESHLSKGSKEWTLDQVTGQVYFAFLASFDTTTSTLTMTLHELALHPEIEEKLYQEIKTHHDKEGELIYDNINELPYLTCVLNETSRKWSSALMMDRVCSKTYILPPSRDNGTPYKLYPGDMVYNVVNSIHLDPKYHPDPLEYNPDRFSNANKHKIKPFTYMPFGMGPRSCLGVRYATLNMKVILYHLVLTYKIVKCEKTQDPIRLEPNELSIRAIGGTYLQFKIRN